MPDVNKISTGLGFTLADLALNRIGRLSAGQTWYSWKQAFVSSTMLALAISAIPAIFFIGRSGKLVKVISVLTSIVLTPLFGLMTSRDVRAAFARRAEHAEGKVELVGGTRGTHVRIGRFDGVLPIGAMDVLPAGIDYRVYYLPYSEAFLSIEPVTPANAPPAPPPPK
jgi:hypothetical protein